MVLASTTATIVAPVISAAAALIGVIVGSAATTRRERLARQEAAEHTLNASALGCLARARKIYAADQGTYETAAQDRENEIKFLGPDLDTYVAAIATVDDRATRTRHWKIYEQTLPILIGHEADNLPRVIKALEQIRGELMEAGLEDPSRSGRRVREFLFRGRLRRNR
jgi:hypothetical protein